MELSFSSRAFLALRRSNMEGLLSGLGGLLIIDKGDFCRIG